MHDGDQNVGKGRASRATVGVSRFAEAVVARLVAKDPVSASTFREAFLDRLIDVIQGSDGGNLDALKGDMRRLRISPAMLADLYIPEAALRLGVAWEEDCMSFTEVTVGTARLQSILREVSSGWAADETNGTSTASVLLLLPNAEQHTLGPMVLMSKLRRLGVSVCLRLATNDIGLKQLLRERRFDGVMISLGCEDRLEAGRNLVKTLRDIAGRPLPIVVGGAVLSRRADVMEVTMADAVTNDVEEALKAFGLITERQSATTGA